MIYLLHGTDTEKSRGKLHALINSLLAKRPDATHIRLTDETFAPETLAELIGSMGLFAPKAIVEMNMVFRNNDAQDAVMDHIKEIAESENIFVFLEAALNKPERTKFGKHAEKIVESNLPEGSGK